MLTSFSKNLTGFLWNWEAVTLQCPSVPFSHHPGTCVLLEHLLLSKLTFIQVYNRYCTIRHCYVIISLSEEPITSSHWKKEWVPFNNFGFTVWAGWAILQKWTRCTNANEKSCDLATTNRIECVVCFFLWWKHFSVYFVPGIHSYSLPSQTVRLVVL